MTEPKPLTNMSLYVHTRRCQGLIRALPNISDIAVPCDTVHARKLMYNEFACFTSLHLFVASMIFLESNGPRDAMFLGFSSSWGIYNALATFLALFLIPTREAVRSFIIIRLAEKALFFFVGSMLLLKKSGAQDASFIGFISAWAAFMLVLACVATSLILPPLSTFVTIPKPNSRTVSPNATHHTPNNSNGLHSLFRIPADKCVVS